MARYRADPSKHAQRMRRYHVAHPERARERARRWREANREKSRAKALRWYHANLEAARLKRKRQILQSWGLTIPQYEEMLAGQGNGCGICGKPCSTGRRLAVDHDHQTGKVRGLLCSSCNLALGKFKDDEALLLAAVRYLRIHRARAMEKAS